MPDKGVKLSLFKILIHSLFFSIFLSPSMCDHLNSLALVNQQHIHVFHLTYLYHLQRIIIFQLASKDLTPS